MCLPSALNLQILSMLPIRKNLRLKEYDYSSEGYYFVTICVHQGKSLFGSILNSEMILNDAGHMIHKWYNELENKFPDIKCHEMITMPNHFHCIIEKHISVGCSTQHTGRHIGLPLQGDLDIVDVEELVRKEEINTCLATVAQWFKTMTTNSYIKGVKENSWEKFNGRFWHRNYYEHIIRNYRSYENIANYIITNPARWVKDVYNLEK